MTITCMDGFEFHQLQGMSVYGAPTSYVTDAWKSNVAAEFAMSNTRAGWYQWDQQSNWNTGSTQINWTTGANRYASWHIKFTSWPGSGQYHALYAEYGNAQWRAIIRVNESGQVEIRDESTIRDTSAALELDQWYCFDFRRATEQVWIEIYTVPDEELVDSIYSGAGSTFYSPNQLHSIVWGPGNSVNGAGGGVSYGTSIWDNWLLSSNERPSETIGTKDYCIDRGLVNGQGTYNDADWTGTYADVDEVPPDNSTTYRAISGSATGYFSCTIDFTPLYTPESIHAVSIAGRHQHPSGTAGTQRRLLVRSGSTDTFCSAVNHATSTWEAAGSYPLLVDPNTSSAWDVSAVEAVEVGYDRYTPPITSNSKYVTMLGLEVLMIPAAEAEAEASAIPGVAMSPYLIV